MDTLLRGVDLPDMELGEWLVWPHMGAYTLAAGSNFNGFDSQAVDVHYVFSPPVVRPRRSVGEGPGTVQSMGRNLRWRALTSKRALSSRCRPLPAQPNPNEALLSSFSSLPGTAFKLPEAAAADTAPAAST